MIRGLRYWIQFATSNGLTLVHEMTLDEDSAEGMRESFAIEGTGVHGADFTPAQMALLHCAILEMKRMHDQHVETLTDGESVGAVERVVAREDGEQPDPTPDEVERALTFTDVEHNVLLTMAAAEITLRLGDPGFLALFNAGFIQVTDESMSRPTANREYAITARGRERLAAQTPEAEGGLGSIDYGVLAELAKSGNALLGIGHDPNFTWEKSGALSYLTSESLQNLCDHRLVVFTTTFPVGAPDCKRRWHITDKGRRVLAEREG